MLDLAQELPIDGKLKEKVLVEKGNYMLQIELFDSAVDSFKKAYECSLNEDHLANLILAFNNSKSFQTALEYYLKILNGNTISNELIRQKILFECGVLFYKIHEFENSLKYLEKSISLFNLDRKNESYALHLLNIGNAYLKLNKYFKSLEIYNEALDIMRNIHKNETCCNIAHLLIKIGIVYIKIESYEEALSYLKQSLEIYKCLNSKEIVDNLKQIGFVYFKLGKYKQSLENYELSYKMCIKLDRFHELKSELFYQIGVVSRNLGKYKKSLDYMKESYKIYKEVFEELDYRLPHDAVTFQQAAHIHDNLGKCVKALEYYEKSIECFSLIKIYN